MFCNYFCTSRSTSEEDRNSPLLIFEGFDETSSFHAGFVDGIQRVRPDFSALCHLSKSLSLCDYYQSYMNSYLNSTSPKDNNVTTTHMWPENGNMPFLVIVYGDFRGLRSIQIWCAEKQSIHTIACTVKAVFASRYFTRRSPQCRLKF